VKQLLRQADPAFDERAYGFGNLSDLLRAAGREGLVRVDRDRQGVIRVFQGAAAPTASAQPSTPAPVAAHRGGSGKPKIFDIEDELEEIERIREANLRQRLGALAGRGDSTAADQEQETEPGNAAGDASYAETAYADEAASLADEQPRGEDAMAAAEQSSDEASDVATEAGAAPQAEEPVARKRRAKKAASPKPAGRTRRTAKS
jgi:hypothetical protein